MNTKILLTIISLMIFKIGFTQITADWEVNLESKVRWMEYNVKGINIVKTDGEIVGIDPVQKKVIWSVKSTAVAKRPKDILNSSYVILDKNDISDLQYIINVKSGKIVFDTEKEGLAGLKTLWMANNEASLLLSARKGSNSVIVLLDLKNATKVWTTSITDELKVNLTGKSLFSNKNEMFFIPGVKRIFALNALSGEMVWQKEVKKKIRKIVLSEEDNALITIDGNLGHIAGDRLNLNTMPGSFNMIAYDLKIGNPMWKKPLKVKGKFATAISVKEGLLVSYANGLNLLDVSTGLFQWKASPKVFGEMTHFMRTEKGFFIATEYVWQSSSMGVPHGANSSAPPVRPKPKENAYNYYIGFDGLSLWHKKANNEVRPSIIEISNAPKGLMSVRQQNTVLFDKEGMISKENELAYFHFTRFPYMEKPGFYIVLADDKKLYRINTKEGKWEAISSIINFSDDAGFDKFSISASSGGYVLSSSREYILVGFDGKVKSQNRYHQQFVWERYKDEVDRINEIAGLTVCTAPISFRYPVSAISKLYKVVVFTQSGIELQGRDTKVIPLKKTVLHNGTIDYTKYKVLIDKIGATLYLAGGINMLTGLKKKVIAFDLSK